MKRTAIVRSTPLARSSRLPARRATPRRSERVRAPAYLAWIRTLTCAASHLPGHVCEGPIEADHVGARPLGRKCDDRETIALCSLAHRQRTDHCGPFRHFTRDDMRAFIAQALLDTADAYARHIAGIAGHEAS